MQKPFFIISILLFSVTGFAQQITLDDYLPLLHHNNGDLLFNPLAVNPAIADDSSKIHGRAMFQERWIGFSNSPKEINFSVSGQIPNTFHNAGIELEWWGNSSIRKSLVRFNYSYKYVFNQDNFLRGGINLDISSIRMDDELIQVLKVPSDVFYMSNIHLGLCYTYKKRRLGIAYGGLFKNELDGTRKQFPVSERGLIINYTSWTKLGPSLRFQSDMLIDTDFKKIDYYLMTKFILKERFSGGVFYNSAHKSKGFVVSGYFFKTFELGYEFYFDVIQNQLLGGQSFYLGYRIAN